MNFKTLNYIFPQNLKNSRNFRLIPLTREWFEQLPSSIMNICCEGTWTDVMLQDLSHLTSLTHLYIYEKNMWCEIELTEGLLSKSIADIHTIFQNIPALTKLDIQKCKSFYDMVSMTKYDVIICDQTRTCSAKYIERDGKLFCYHVKTEERKI